MLTPLVVIRLEGLFNPCPASNHGRNQTFEGILVMDPEMVRRRTRVLQSSRTGENRLISR
jgi:hypothetical protein